MIMGIQKKYAWFLEDLLIPSLEKPLRDSDVIIKDGKASSHKSLAVKSFLSEKKFFK